MDDLEAIIEMPVDPGLPEDTTALHAAIEGLLGGQTDRRILLLASTEASASEGPAIVGRKDCLVPRGDFTPNFPFHVLIDISILYIQFPV